MNVNSLNKTVKGAGFSLIEMLVVIAVIGILAGVSIAQIGKLNDASKEAKIRRNAQSVASIFASAQAAGLNFYVAGDKTATIQGVVSGGTVTAEGPFKGSYFGVPAMSQNEQDASAVYLEMDDTNSLLGYKAF